MKRRGGSILISSPGKANPPEIKNIQNADSRDFYQIYTVTTKHDDNCRMKESEQKNYQEMYMALSLRWDMIKCIVIPSNN